jgi:cystathionine gamma-synthase
MYLKFNFIVAVVQVFYPKFVSRKEYEVIRRPSNSYSSERYPSGGYGCLLSIVLRSTADHIEHDTINFYDTLNVCKGPSLGTNFTLVCPYTLLAHYEETDWAATYGVSKYLIRISVGSEDDLDALLQEFERALK